MEMEVRIVGGIESCFVSLPLSLIETLQSTRSAGILPPVLALELKSRDNDVWNVAWSGSCSSSSAIEVAQQLAECISLPNHMTVQVRAIANLTKAKIIMVEPNNEDDWEILELNSEHAEAAILEQVGIVHEGMRFPLWLHGHIVLEFLVVSTSPKNSIVQLVPGTEVAVAPKRRKMNVEGCNNFGIQTSVREQSMIKTLLRVQDSYRKSIHRCMVNGVSLNVVLTSFVFIHPETAKNLMFDNLQLVIIFPRLGKDKVKNLESNSSSSVKKGNTGSLTEKEAARYTIVRLLYSETASKGHLMLPQSLRLYLGASLHSWIYVKECNISPMKNAPSLALSPCQFKPLGKSNSVKENGSGLIDIRKNPKNNDTSFGTTLAGDVETIDFSCHEELVASLSPQSHECETEETATLSRSSTGQQSLLHAWFVAQLGAVISSAGPDVRSLVLANETLLHFEVIDRKLRNHEEEHATSSGFLDERGERVEAPLQLLFLLKVVESSQGGLYGTYEVAPNFVNKNTCDLGCLEMSFEKSVLGQPIYLNCIREKTFQKRFSSTIASLSWLEAAISDVSDRLAVLLSSTSGKLFSTYKLPLPGHVLICGPPGSGKTSLLNAVAKSFEEHEEILAHIIFVNCASLSLEKTQSIQQAITDNVSEAIAHSPSLIIFDDLDSIVSSSLDSEISQSSASTVALVEFLTDIIDEYGEKRQSTCGIGPVAFVASVQSLGNLPQSWSSSGRFDYHVQLPTPAALERAAILKHEIHNRSLQCSEDILHEVASKCDGYDAYDLEILVDRAVHTAVRRFLASYSSINCEKPVLVKDDLLEGMNDFVPVAMRGITKSASDGGHTGWEDVGGLINVRNAVQEMIELPSKFPNIFAKAPLRLRSNVLLYGPPGCGKTHIVGAAAAACSLRFISVKGPELLNKYIGASEQAVRDIFSKATAASPCLLFFDEFDSIAPKRGHDNTGVTDRVVNQLLTELDGVEVLTGVFVFAATSRPDLLDAALLRPGRLDRLLFCDFPSWHERVDILKVLSRKLPLASDVDLEAVASATDGFSGADLQALLSDAQLASVHELLDSGDCDKPGKMPVISAALLSSVASTARPSVSVVEKQRLYGIYSQFLDSKKAVAAQSRDAKGKRATLA